MYIAVNTGKTAKTITEDTMPRPLTDNHWQHRVRELAEQGINAAEIAENLEAGVAGLDGEQVEFAGEIDVGDDAVDGLERGEF